MISELMNIQACTLPNSIPFLLIYFHLPHFLARFPVRLYDEGNGNLCSSSVTFSKCRVCDIPHRTSPHLTQRTSNFIALSTSQLTPHNKTLTDKRTAVQEISHTVHSCCHNSPPLFAVLSQINPVRNLSPHFFRISFNIVLPSKPVSFK